MKVRTLGKKENPAIVMIPGMFCTSDMPEIVAKYLADDFYMILPTLDGHHGEEPVYHSKQDDAGEIVSWLHTNGVERLAILQGTSMGAEVALETARQIDLPAFDEEQIRRFTFLYSKNEPARKAEIRLRRKYPNAEYLIMKSRGHGGFQAERPEEYAELMRNEAGCGKG